MRLTGRKMWGMRGMSQVLNDHKNDGGKKHPAHTKVVMPQHQHVVIGAKGPWDLLLSPGWHSLGGGRVVGGWVKMGG